MEGDGEDEGDEPEGEEDGEEADAEAEVADIDCEDAAVEEEDGEFGCGEGGGVEDLDYGDELLRNLVRGGICKGESCWWRYL